LEGRCTSPTAEIITSSRVVLVGDAAHLASPITGAGGRLAMEDALTLADALAGHDDLDEALASFSEVARALARRSSKRGAAGARPFERRARRGRHERTGRNVREDSR
jgi:2-polyprenyl-6-methoxyphenol hydroxylase-like FAD-dependent oxidoreductase